MGIAALHPSYALAVLLLQAMAQNRLRANSDLLSHFNVIWVVQSSASKYFA
jgi:hypothetical protein